MKLVNCVPLMKLSISCRLKFLSGNAFLYFDFWNHANIMKESNQAARQGKSMEFPFASLSQNQTLEVTLHLRPAFGLL